jgi:hypothetical protein
VSLKSNQCFSFAPQQPLKSYELLDEGLALHMALSVRVPALHDLVPERVYPESQVGLHDVPCASVEVHPEPGAPFVMAPDASHKGASTRVLSSIEDPPESAVSG